MKLFTCMQFIFRYTFSAFLHQKRSRLTSKVKVKINFKMGYLKINIFWQNFEIPNYNTMNMIYYTKQITELLHHIDKSTMAWLSLNIKSHSVLFTHTCSICIFSFLLYVVLSNAYLQLNITTYHSKLYSLKERAARDINVTLRMCFLMCLCMCVSVCMCVCGS